MSDVAIRVVSLSKRYRIGIGRPGRTFREALADVVSGPFRRSPSNDETTEFWALKDVSFEVNRGEVVGIIGRNGAGKSTLLKILSRITEPTSGRAEVYGRVGSLLEVGTGFHPELTGRENIYLNGAILGMKRREIERQFDEIVDFAEVERFIDTPVKHFSSGMYVRLAFAVAAHLEPETLIVDEVLAVGDSAFQRKCLGKMGDVARGGRTVFFVSHNLAAVRTLCNRALHLNNGELESDSDVEKGLSIYLTDCASDGGVIEWDPRLAPQSPEIRFVRAHISNDRGEQASELDCRKSFLITLDYQVLKPLRNLRIGFFLQNSEGIPICGSNDPGAWQEPVRSPGLYTSRCTFPGHVLNAGVYSAYFGADTPPSSTPLVTTPYCLTFTVEDTQGHGPLNEKLPGLIRPELNWEVLKLPEV